jgi:putative transposase
MARVARVVVPDCPHHVTQRGNRRTAIFRDEEDRKVYIALLKKYAEKHGLDIWAYCLMSNHVHHVAVPRTVHSLSRTFRDAHTAYALWFNKQWGQSGHAFQGRFFSCPMDDSYMWATVRYIERNPVKARFVERAEDYPWSSASAHCGLRDDDLLREGFPPEGVISNWSAWLGEEEDKQMIKTIRRQTHTGRPCGGKEFTERLETILGRSLRPLKRGPKTHSHKQLG